MRHTLTVVSRRACRPGRRSRERSRRRDHSRPPCRCARCDMDARPGAGRCAAAGRCSRPSLGSRRPGDCAHRRQARNLPRACSALLPNRRARALHTTRAGALHSGASRSPPCCPSEQVGAAATRNCLDHVVVPRRQLARCRPSNRSLGRRAPQAASSADRPPSKLVGRITNFPLCRGALSGNSKPLIARQEALWPNVDNRVPDDEIQWGSQRRAYSVRVECRPESRLARPASAAG